MSAASQTQARRAMIAARNLTTVPNRTNQPGTDLLSRQITSVQPCPGVMSRKGKRPSSDKGQGLWRTVRASDKSGRDPKWSATVSDGIRL